MTDHKKVAIITPFLANGGLEKVAIVEAEELSKEFDVTLIVMDSFHVDYAYSGKMIDLNVSLMDRGVFKRFYNIASSALKLRKLKKEHSFDIVISHGELANLPNVFSGGKNNILTIHENRFAALKDMQGKVVNKIIKYIYSAKSVFKIVTVSEGIRESFIHNLGLKEDKIVAIHNPYEIDKIKELSQESIEPFDALFSHNVLMSAGRLTMAKGQWYLLRIFRELKKKHADLKLVILGDGEMKEDLLLLAEDLELKIYSVWLESEFSDTYDVYFLGFQKNPFKFIKQAKLFAMTSLWEGFGSTLVESMACGTPVVSADCQSGPGEILDPEYKYGRMLNKPHYNGFGLLMPAFKNNLVDANIALDGKELIWIETLDAILKDDKKLQNYSRIGLKRAEDFQMEVIMSEWKILIYSCLLLGKEVNKC